PGRPLRSGCRGGLQSELRLQAEGTPGLVQRLMRRLMVLNRLADVAAGRPVLWVEGQTAHERPGCEGVAALELLPVFEGGRRPLHRGDDVLGPLLRCLE